jgi:hypothetical protein
MRKKFVIFGLLLVLSIAAIVWFYCGPVPGVGGGLSAYDVVRIRRAIRQHATAPILSIHGEGSGMATVTVGVVKGRIGSGWRYYLNETENGWKVVGNETWL